MSALPGDIFEILININSEDPHSEELLVPNKYTDTSVLKAIRIHHCTIKNGHQFMLTQLSMDKIYFLWTNYWTKHFVHAEGKGFNIQFSVCYKTIAVII